MSAAARASALSNPLTPAMTGARRCGAAGRPVAVGAAVGRGAGVGGAGACAGAGAATTGAAAAAGATGAGAGILIVGAAVGLGGKLIRTVSFFGCTLAASVGFGGTAPEGGFGILSAITFWVQTRVDASRCQMLIRDRSKTARISDFLGGHSQGQMGARNLFRSSGPMSRIWRNEFRAPKKYEMRCATAKRTGENRSVCKSAWEACRQ